jgi:hypothetical protein
MCRSMAILPLMLLLIPTGSATVFVVAPDGSGDFPTIQTALDSAVPGDVVELTGGTFAGDGNRDLDFRGKAITVRSAGGDPAACVIDCGGSPVSPHRGFLFQSAEGPGSIVEGITITGGYPPSAPQSFGGAIALWGACAPTLRRCRIEGNQAPSGGGVGAYQASPRFENCAIAGNTVTGSGGGLSFVGGSPVLDACLLAGNEAGSGGALAGNTGSISLIRCTLVENRAAVGAGWRGYSGATLGADATLVVFNRLGASVACDGGSSASFACCDVFGNDEGDWVACIQGQLGQSGNLSRDPVFCLNENPDDPYTLLSSSPCAPASQPECGLIGALPVGCSGFYVTADGTGAYPTIQAAIDAAPDGSLIQLGDGTFSGPGNRDLDFGGKNLVLRSRSLNPDLCILDCQGSGRGLWFHASEESTSVVRAITIRDGYAAAGGAILCEGASPTLLGCVLAENHAEEGGAIACRASRLRVAQCTLAGNRSPSGGGLRCGPLSDVILSNTIVAFSPQGEGLACAGGAAALACCDIYGNAGGDWVGPIADQLGVDGNLVADPLFCGGRNFHLAEGSPCLPTAPPGQCDGIGVFGAGCMGDVFLMRGGQQLLRYPTIQAALDHAQDGDALELGDGVFRGPGNRNCDCRGLRIAIRSRSGDAASCVIDCESVHRAVTFGPDGALENVTVRNAYRPAGSGVGGAIVLGGGASTVRGCRFEGNAGDEGDAIYLLDWDARATIRDCVFRGNHGPGEVVRIRCDSLHVSGCEFSDNLDEAMFAFANQLDIDGSAFLRNPIALSLDASHGTVRNCRFEGNTGGAIALGHGISVLDSDFLDNGAPEEGVAIVDAFGGTSALTGCTLAGNTGDQVIRMKIDSGLRMERTIIAFNQAASVECYDSAHHPGWILADCCDIFGNAGGDWIGCLAGHAGTDGNLSADPFFCDPDSGNYGLQAGSPCRPFPPENPECDLMGAHPVGCGPAVAEEAPASAARLLLEAGRPNPFTRSTLIAFQVPTADAGRPFLLAVYDLQGRRVRVLLDGPATSGSRRAEWDGNDQGGSRLPGGIYFCRLSVGEEKRMTRIVRLP